MSDNFTFTIYTVAKPFYGDFDQIQRNAILSWTKIRPTPNIVIFGSEYGTAEFAEEIGAQHVPAIAKTPYDSPDISNLLQRADGLIRTEIKAFVCSDIILPPTFAKYLFIAKHRFSKFVMFGRATELSAPESRALYLNDHPDKFANICQLTSGRSIENLSARYFAYNYNTWNDLPTLSLGGIHWHNALISEAILTGVETIDATKAIAALHQSHHYRYTKWGTRERIANSMESRLEAELCKECTAADFAAQSGHLLDSSGSLQSNHERSANILSSALEQRHKMLAMRAVRLCLEGQSLERSGRCDRALNQIDHAIRIDPNSPGVNIFRAICLASLKRFGEAEAILVQQLKDPQFKESAEQLLQLYAEKQGYSAGV